MYDTIKKRKSMTKSKFTPEQEAALNALEGEFGPVDPYLHNVRNAQHVDDEYGYAHWIKRSLTEALRSWGQYKYALSVDWEAEERKRKLEEARKLAERKAGVRESVVLGFMSGLLPKITRIAPKADVTFEVGEEVFELHVIFESFAHYSYMAYDRETHVLKTRIVRPERLADECEEVLTLVNANTSPTEQVTGYNVFVKHLESVAGASL